MSMAEAVLARWAADPVRGAPFVAEHHRPAQPAQAAPLPDWLAPPLRAALEARGIQQLYGHQAEALAQVQAGRDVVVATPTASGKSLVYNLSALQAIHADPDARALYLFPTKALAHDQVAGLDALARAAGVAVGAHAYDGDTPADARRAIRAGARIVVTNPDMLHMGILPHHDKWAGLFGGLTHVVIDEAHVYRGVFGSHVANVIRRLKRVCAWHGATPRFILSSATIANPAEHASALVEREVVAITRSGAPQGARHFRVYNPPLVDGTTGVRQSYIKAARQVTRRLARAGVPTIVFCNSRLSVERLTRHLKEDVAADGGDPQTVEGYRGGYLPQRRRAIEAGLRSGQIQIVVTTNALELGVDIGQLAACVLAGYPGSIASTLQRAGRAGRRDDPASVVLVARSEPVDQYLARHPEWFHAQNPERARLLADHLLIVAEHIKCAAFELPFAPDEGLGGFGVAHTQEVLGWLAGQGVLHQGARWQWVGPPYPAQKVPLRAIADGNFVVLDQQHQHTIIGEVDFHTAAEDLHPQAIYIVGGQTYQVQRLDWTGRRAYVDPVHVDYYTDAMTYDGVRPLVAFAEHARAHARVAHGELRVFERVVGFKKIRFATGENVGYGEVDLPENDLHTTGLWIRPGPSMAAACGLPPHRLVDTLRGLAQALVRVAAVHLMADARDLGHSVEGGADAPGAQPPALFIYERYPGGVGLHEALYTGLDRLLGELDGLLAGCGCADGCPACVGAPTPVLGEDAPRSRADARRVLAALRAVAPAHAAAR